MSSSVRLNRKSYKQQIGTPFDRYQKAVKKAQKRGKEKCFRSSLFEIVILAVMIGMTLKYSVPSRAAREIENRFTGSISLSSGNYIGETDFGWFLGEGRFYFDTGTVYTGSWEDNVMEGAGSLAVPLRATYVGDFSDSKKNGFGTCTWDDGTIYTGYWEDDRMDGQGEYTDPYGTVYSGTFRDNALYVGECVFSNRTGTYTLHYRDGHAENVEIVFANGDRYSGECGSKAINGNGQMVFQCGDEYHGSYLSGVRNGDGEYKWLSGDRYNGEWANDRMKGKGTYYFADGSVINGEFSNNLLVSGTYETQNEFGSYVFSFADRKPVRAHIVLTEGSTYIGEMDAQGLNGKAEIRYSNGDTYSGTVKNSCRNGYGEYNWQSGAKYTGYWASDMMSGQGTYEYPPTEDGFKLTGYFKDGLPDGVCEYYTSSTTRYRTTWQNGSCVRVTE